MTERGRAWLRTRGWGRRREARGRWVHGPDSGPGLALPLSLRPEGVQGLGSARVKGEGTGECHPSVPCGEPRSQTRDSTPLSGGGGRGAWWGAPHTSGSPRPPPAQEAHTATPQRTWPPRPPPGRRGPATSPLLPRGPAPPRSGWPGHAGTTAASGGAAQAGEQRRLTVEGGSPWATRPAPHLPHLQETEPPCD